MPAEESDIESVSSIGWLCGILTFVCSMELVELLAKQSFMAGLVGDSGPSLQGLGSLSLSARAGVVSKADCLSAVV